MITTSSSSAKPSGNGTTFKRYFHRDNEAYKLFLSPAERLGDGAVGFAVANELVKHVLELTSITPLCASIRLNTKPIITTLIGSYGQQTNTAKAKNTRSTKRFLRQ